MTRFPRSFLTLFLALTFGLAAARPQDPKADFLLKPAGDNQDQTNLRKVSETRFVHERSGLSFTVPEGWKEIKPQRLARSIDQRVSTVLRIEKAAGDVSASIFWIPLNPGQKLADWVRDAPVAKEYGEEYETLKAVYGDKRISVPVRTKIGAFDMYRINILGGPERGDRVAGSLFIFLVDGADSPWLVKVRISYPKGDPTVNEQFTNELLKGFAHVAR